MGCPCNKCIVLAICKEPCENFTQYALRWKRRAIQIKVAILFIFVSIVFFSSLVNTRSESLNILLIFITVSSAILALIAGLINEYIYIPRSLKKMLVKLPYEKLLKAGIFEYYHPSL